MHYDHAAEERESNNPVGMQHTTFNVETYNETKKVYCIQAL